MPFDLLAPLLLAALGAGLAVALGVVLARRGEAVTSVGGSFHERGGRWLPAQAAHGESLSPEVLKQVRAIHIRTGRRVDALLAGEYASVFKGRGMEFEEVREYVPGDDVRAIDWNVTARMERPFVKEFREERELVVMIVVDVSSSGDFGTSGRAKNELAAELAATLAFAATRTGDKVGLLLFTDRVERFVPPRKGRGHVFRVVREVLHCHRKGSGTDLAEALAFLDKVLRRKAVVFLVSDFLDERDYETPLRLINRRHDLVVFRVTDPRERELPEVGYVAVEDAETGAPALIDTSSRAVRDAYVKAARLRTAELSGRLRRLDVDLVDLCTDEPVGNVLARYFRARERRFR
jgi:uncharacterized protein (DUF58 family)